MDDAAGQISGAVVTNLSRASLRDAVRILFSAYRQQPTFQYLFHIERRGYNQRLRGAIRELVNLYYASGDDAIGLIHDGRLVGVAFVGNPELRLNLPDQFMWRLRMMLSAGWKTTARYLDYHRQLQSAVPAEVQQLPLMAVHPDFQRRGFGRILLEAVEQRCRRQPGVKGLLLDTGDARHLNFYQAMGFEKTGDVSLGSISAQVFYKPLVPAG